MLTLFDLDDPLLDHTLSFQAATAAIHRIAGGPVSLDEFAQRWSIAHRRNFDGYLAGELTHEEQRARVRESIDPNVGDTQADRLFDAYLAAYEWTWRLFDDVLPCCLSAVAGARLGVITNGQPKQQRQKLERLGIADRFEQVVLPEECGHAKPDPRIFMAASRTFGCEPSGALCAACRLSMSIARASPIAVPLVAHVSMADGRLATSRTCTSRLRCTCQSSRQDCRGACA